MKKPGFIISAGTKRGFTTSMELALHVGKGLAIDEDVDSFDVTCTANGATSTFHVAVEVRPLRKGGYRWNPNRSNND